MEETIISLMSDYGYIGIAFLIFIENIFPPIPSEVVLLFGGFMTTTSNITPWGVVAAATLGSTLGAGALYALGRGIGKERLAKLLAGKTGRVLHLEPSDVEKADKWFAKYEHKAVFFGRCIPIVRSLISIPAGISAMPVLPFFIFTAAGSAVWNTLLVWLGAGAGSAWKSSLQYFGWYSNAALVVLAAAGLIWLAVLAGKRKNGKS